MPKLHISKELKLADATTGVAWSPDGTSLAAYSNFGQLITVWDASGSVIKTLERHPKQPFVGSSLDFLGDSDTLITPPATRENPQDERISLSVWDIRKGIVVRSIDGSEPGKNWGYNWADRFVTTDDKQSVAVVTAGLFTRYISIFSTQSGHLIRNISIGPLVGPAANSVQSMTFSNDGRYLAAGTIGGKVMLFDTSAGNLVKAFWAYDHTVAGVSTLVFSPDGRFIATGAGLPIEVAPGVFSDPPPVVPPEAGPVRVWRVDDAGYAASYPGTKMNPIRKIGWNKSGLLAFVGGDNTVRLWNPAYKREVAPTVQFNRDVLSLAFSPDGLNLAVCDGNQITVFVVIAE